MTTRPAFAFLDSERVVPQALQQIILRDFAQKNNFAIEFVGAEIYGTEYSHMLLRSYIEEDRWPAYIFFSVHQFIQGSKFIFTSLEKAVELKVPCLFAAEQIMIQTVDELSELRTQIAVSVTFNKHKAYSIRN